MGAADDQKLKALFEAARREDARDIPSFEDVLATRPTSPRPRASWSRPALAAAAMLAIVALITLFGQVLPGPDPAPQIATQGALPIDYSHEPVVADHSESAMDSPWLDQDTRGLLLAMSDGDGFTDFLLLDEDSFFSHD